MFHLRFEVLDIHTLLFKFYFLGETQRFFNAKKDTPLRLQVYRRNRIHKSYSQHITDPKSLQNRSKSQGYPQEKVVPELWLEGPSGHGAKEILPFLYINNYKPLRYIKNVPIRAQVSKDRVPITCSQQKSNHIIPFPAWLWKENYHKQAQNTMGKLSFRMILTVLCCHGASSDECHQRCSLPALAGMCLEGLFSTFLLRAVLATSMIMRDHGEL